MKQRLAAKILDTKRPVMKRQLFEPMQISAVDA
jgi:hypothetical protein